MTINGKRWWTAIALLVLGLFFVLGYIFWLSYHEVRKEAQGSASNYAELIESRLDAALRRADANLGILAEQLPADAAKYSSSERYRSWVEGKLEEFRHAFPEVAGIQLSNNQGQVLFRVGEPGYPNIGQKDYFLAARNQQIDALHFSAVETDHLTSRRVLVVARALRGRSGEFLGVLSILLDLDYFTHAFASISLGQSGAVVVRRTDDYRLVMRYPDLPGELNVALKENHPLRSLGSETREAVIEFAAQTDGVTRIYAYRQLERYPFHVLVGLSTDDVLGEWLGRALGLGLLSLGMLTGVLVMVRRLIRSRERERRMLDTLRRQRQQLSDAQRVARVGSWELDRISGEFNASDELWSLFELEPSSSTDGLERLLAVVHPEDRPIVDQTYQHAVASRQSYQLEHRLLMADGRIKHMLEFGETIYDESGTPLRSVGTVQEITGLRQMEAQMRLLASAFHYSGEAILITDESNRIITVNQAFSVLSGYEEQEAIGQTLDFLSADRAAETLYEEMGKTLRERGFWQGELWDRRKSGAIFPKWMSVSAIVDERNGCRYHVAHFTDVSAERAVEAQLEHLAHHDVLTGLPNRFSLSERLEQALSSARRDRSNIAILFIDLDRFKVINDTLGHHIGDLLLIEVARRLTECVRESDVVARLGGDEFVIILTAIDSPSAAVSVAEKLVFSIGDPCLIDGHDLYTSPSIGIAMFPQDGEDRETLMKNADAAMYHAKALGRNNFQFFDSRMNDAVVERLHIEQSLRQALANDEFRLHFQPIINVASGRVVAVEALVRWQHPEEGLIPPARFIPVAEETGLIQPLGEWVFWAACRQLSDFQAAGLHGVKMGINISAMQLRNDNLPILARGAVELFGFAPQDLIFEITESVAMSRPEHTIVLLENLHEMGIGLAIDDFGTGYSSLSYLRMFPIDHLKLDRSFVIEIGQGPGSASICDATISLVHSLGLELIAEGVEEQHQFDYLRDKGCDLVQGYLFSRPLPAEEVMALIRERNTAL